MFKERNAEVDNKLRELAALQNEVLNALRLNWDLYGDNPIPFNVCQKPSYNPYAPGGYYSPMPSAGDIEGLDRSVQLKAEDIAAIDINETRQRELLDEFDAYYGKWPFLAHENKKHRYFYNNDWFNCGDGFFLYSMLRYVKPERIIEAGSGFSSALMLDVNDMFFEGKIELTFIEPNPGRLKGLLRESDRVTLIKRGLQEVDINIFADLKENDILFIDSSHVSKFGSDVNYLIHEILPILNEGVYIHIHDIDWPFDYPGGWLKEGRAYNEAYILRAFLEYNTAFSIEFFESYMMKNYYDEMLGRFPLLENGCGLSLWMRKREA
jgi:predicted O-methyltransferase YrrM